MPAPDSLAPQDRLAYQTAVALISLWLNPDAAPATDREVRSVLLGYLQDFGGSLTDAVESLVSALAGMAAGGILRGARGDWTEAIDVVRAIGLSFVDDRATRGGNS